MQRATQLLMNTGSGGTYSTSTCARLNDSTYGDASHSARVGQHRTYTSLCPSFMRDAYSAMLVSVPCSSADDS